MRMHSQMLAVRHGRCAGEAGAPSHVAGLSLLSEFMGCAQVGLRGGQDKIKKKRKKEGGSTPLGLLLASVEGDEHFPRHGDTCLRLRYKAPAVRPRGRLSGDNHGWVAQV